METIMGNTRLISADLGNGWTKVKSSSGNSTFRSVISVDSQSIDFTMPFDAEKRFKIEYGGQKYSVGDTVFTDGLLPLQIEDRSRIETGFYKILFAASMASVLKQSTTVSPVVSLPPASYWDRGKLKEYLAGVYEVTVPQGNNKTRTLTFDVPIENIRVIPEGMGAICELCLSETGRESPDAETLFNSTVGVLDIGALTADVLKFLNLRLSRNGTDSSDFGVSKSVLKSIKQHASKHGISLPDHQLDQILRQGYYIDGSIKGNRRDISSEIDEWIRHEAVSIEGFVRSQWGGGNDVEYIIVTGGGAHLIYPHIARIFGEDRVFTSGNGEPQFSNCEGGYRYGLLREMTRA